MGKGEEKSDNVVDKLIEQMSKNLQTGEGVSYALKKIMDIRPSLTILKKHNIKNNIKKYYTDPNAKTAKLANEVKEFMDYLKMKAKFDPQQPEKAKQHIQEQKVEKDKKRDEAAAAEAEKAKPKHTKSDDARKALKIKNKSTVLNNAVVSTKTETDVKKDNSQLSDNKRKRKNIDEPSTSAKKPATIQFKEIDIFPASSSKKQKRDKNEKAESSSTKTHSIPWFLQKPVNLPISKNQPAVPPSQHAVPVPEVVNTKRAESPVEPPKKKSSPVCEESQFRYRTEQTRVFAGVKQKAQKFRTSVPSLMTLAQETLLANPKYFMQDLKLMPLDFAQERLSKFIPDRLRQFLLLNPRLADEIDHHFEPHIENHFPNAPEKPDKFETYCDYYYHLEKTKIKEINDERRKWNNRFDRISQKVLDQAPARARRSMKLIDSHHVQETRPENKSFKKVIAQPMKPTGNAVVLMKSRRAMFDANKGKRSTPLTTRNANGVVPVSDNRSKAMTDAIKDKLAPKTVRAQMAADAKRTADAHPLMKKALKMRNSR